MDKYTLLMALNTPLVLYGLTKALGSYRKGRIKTGGLLIRASFWIIVLVGLLFARDIYEYLLTQGLTDSQPLSLADVVEVTGLSFCLFLILRLYTKLDNQEHRFTELHEKLSIHLSKQNETSK